MYKRQTVDSSSSPPEFSSSSSESDDEIEPTENINGNEDAYLTLMNESVVIIHETQWTFGKAVTTDSFKHPKYNPRVLVDDPKSLSVLDYWIFFPFKRNR